MSEQAGSVNTRTPNLVGVGAGRCGTSYLYELFNRARDIYMAPIKEANYFGIRQQPFQRNGMTFAEYVKLFEKAADQKYVAEITPVYLGHPVALHLMRVQLVGPVKIVVTLRDPISRFRSQYLFHQDRHQYEEINRFAEDAMAKFDPGYFSTRWYAPEMILRGSFYAAGVRRAIDLFGGRNVLVLYREDLLRDAATWAASLEKFLGIPIPVLDKPSVNAASGSDAQFGETVRAKLTSLFRPDIERLSQLVEVDHLRKWPTASFLA